VLAVVENQQELKRLELGEEGSEDRRRFAPQGPQVERLGDGAGDLRTVGNGVQLDEQHAVLVGRSAVSGELERKPSLADASGAGEREQPCVREQRRELAELVLAADEGRRLDRQRTHRGPCPAQLRQQLVELSLQVGQTLALEGRPVVVTVLWQ
jgi:hypothetical protein